MDWIAWVEAYKLIMISKLWRDSECARWSVWVRRKMERKKRGKSVPWSDWDGGWALQQAALSSLLWYYSLLVPKGVHATLSSVFFSRFDEASYKSNPSEHVVFHKIFFNIKINKIFLKYTITKNYKLISISPSVLENNEWK